MITVAGRVDAPAGVKLPIYMDNQATTLLDPRVLEAMMPFLTTRFGNAASRNHSFGWDAEKAVETAREQIASLIGATAKEIIFTSGATESDNLAIKGIAEMYRERGNHIVTQITEHKAVLDTCKRLEKCGYRVTYLPVKGDGIIDFEDLMRTIDEKTILVTIMAANNEIGVLQPIRDIGKLCHEKGVLFHTDAVQALGKVPFDVIADYVDVASISAHKIYGPKGVGALYVRRRNPRAQIVAQIDGGGHERGMRSGTLNVPGIVGLGKACEIARDEMASEATMLCGLRDRLTAFGYEAIFRVPIAQIFPGLYETVELGIEERLAKIEDELGQSAAKGREAIPVARKLEFLCGRRSPESNNDAS